MSRTWFKRYLKDIAVNKPRYGRAIGSHLGKPIYESIQEEETRYTFDRLAQCDEEGCPLDQVKKNELLVNPGALIRVIIIIGHLF